MTTGHLSTSRRRPAESPQERRGGLSGPVCFAIMAVCMVVLWCSVRGKVRRNLQETPANAMGCHEWRLEVGTAFQVRRLAHGRRTRFEDGTLFIDKQELLARIAESGRPLRILPFTSRIPANRAASCTFWTP